MHGTWVKSYELGKRDTEFGWIGSAGERRARELAEAGYYDSATYRYSIERRHIGKYAEYRCTGRKLREGKKLVQYSVPSLGMKLSKVE